MSNQPEPLSGMQVTLLYPVISCWLCRGSFHWPNPWQIEEPVTVVIEPARPGNNAFGQPAWHVQGCATGEQLRAKAEEAGWKFVAEQAICQRCVTTIKALAPLLTDVQHMQASNIEQLPGLLDQLATFLEAAGDSDGALQCHEIAIRYLRAPGAKQ